MTPRERVAPMAHYRARECGPDCEAVQFTDHVMLVSAPDELCFIETQWFARQYQPVPERRGMDDRRATKDGGTGYLLFSRRPGRGTHPHRRKQDRTRANIRGEE